MLVHSCGSIAITGTIPLDTLAPLTKNTAVTTGTCYIPKDGQPSAANGGTAWPYTAGYTYTAVNGKKFPPTVVGTPLGIDYGSPNTLSGPPSLPPSRSPGAAPVTSSAPVSKGPTSKPTVSMAPTVNLNKVPTGKPVVVAAAANSNASREASSNAGIALGIISVVAVVGAAYFFKDKLKDTFFGPKAGVATLIDEKDGKFELGSLDQAQDASAWIQMETTDGRPYWYNIDTCTTEYVRPAVLSEPLGEAAAWSTHYTDAGRPYYYNANNGTSTYDMPKCLQ